jgi:hypothetical protein
LASPFIGLVYAVLLPGKLFQLAMAEMKAESDKKIPDDQLLEKSAQMKNLLKPAWHFAMSSLRARVLLSSLLIAGAALVTPAAGGRRRTGRARIGLPEVPRQRWPEDENGKG